ncbi:hypothetical protein, partial [Xanthomonas oryzae]|uniref:hypothetical protein n=1 Tax=Xanthomonas oryzae TaxID=347 RepID=UPI003CCF4191
QPGTHAYPRTDVSADRGNGMKRAKIRSNRLESGNQGHAPVTSWSIFATSEVPGKMPMVPARLTAGISAAC